jgi:hypothetical protein
MPKTSNEGLYKLTESVADNIASSISAKISDQHALDNDLRNIFHLRLLPVFRLFLNTHYLLQVVHSETFSKIFPLHDSELLNTLKKIGEKEVSIFENDLQTYERRNKERVVDTINKARSDIRHSISKRSINKLVQWDKNFLSFDFIHKKIAVCQFLSDRDFFERLADGIRKRARVEKRAKEKVLIGVLRFYLPALNGFSGLKKKQALKAVYELLSVSNILSEKLYYDYEYFRKYLKRHGIL